ncbi:MAG: PEP-CTERM sorting domain-containing protein [Alphaproteobacteria bacterium]|nr:PEP-CTERM sorting domain-containing protein [Alphaproteobacteria bacterium]
MVGSVGLGRFLQNGGEHDVAGNLVIGRDFTPIERGCGDTAPVDTTTCGVGGPARGTYTMTDGTATIGGDVFVGDKGIGKLDISGPSQFSVTGAIVIANQLGSAGSEMSVSGNGEAGSPTVSSTYLTVGAGAEGSLTLSGGTITVSNQTFVGGSPDGLGHVTQTGGSLETGGLLIGTVTGNGSPNNNYDMSGGSLTVHAAFVIGSGAQGGTFSEGSGGTFTQSNLFTQVEVGAAYINNGTYNLQGGSFTSDDFLKVGDTKTGALFNQTGGSAAITNDLLIGGTYAPAPNAIAGTYNLSGGNLTVGRDIVLGQFAHGDGTFTYTGGSLGFSANEGGHQIVVGAAGKGTFNLGSVGHTVDMDLGALGATLVIGQQAGSNGTFNIAAGSSLEDSLIVGDAGAGNFNNAGGTHSVTGDLTLGNQATGSGTYNLTAGGVTTVTPTGATDGFTFVGRAGQGTFLNDASTHNTKNLVVAEGASSTSTYTLQNGGALNVGTSGNTGFADIGGKGNGKLVQNGVASSTTIYGALDVGRFAGGIGQVDLNAGSMTVNGFAVVGDSGTGTFNQGGASTMDVVGGGLFIGRGQSNENGNTVITGTGTYNLSGTAGLTVTGGIELGSLAGNTGTMTQTGGTVIADSETIGKNGIGHWNQSGGSNTVSGAVIVNDSGTPNGSSLTVSAGSLSAASVTNNDLMTMTGGTVTAPVTNNHQFKLNGGTVVGSVTNKSALDSNGGGTATITGPLSNTATGTTHVSNTSTLVVDGAVTNAGTVTVDTGSKLDASGHTYTQNSGTTTVDGQVAANLAQIILGTLQGTGTVTGNVSNVGGKVRGGDNGAPGALAVTGTYDQQITAAFETTIAGTNPAQVGRLNVGGVATLSGALDVVTQSFTFAAGELFNIMNFASSIGDFTSFNLNGSACSAYIVAHSYTCSGLGSGLYFQEQFANGDTALNLFIAQMTVVEPPTDVPEPMTIGLFVAGIGGVVVIRRRRKAQKSDLAA